MWKSHCGVGRGASGQVDNFLPLSLSLAYDSIQLSQKHLCSLAGPFSPICSSYFSLSLDVIFISFYLSDRVFIFSLSLRISFIPKSHFCTLHSKSVLPVMCCIMMVSVKATYWRNGGTEFLFIAFSVSFYATSPVIPACLTSWK